MRSCLLSYRGYKYSGGQGIYVRYLSSSLQKLGHEVDVLAGPPYPDLVEGINLVKLPSLDLYRLSEPRRLFINPLWLNTWPNFVEWVGECGGYFTEPKTFAMRAYNAFRQNGRGKKYDIVHDNQCITEGILKIHRLGIPLVTTIHHPITIDRELALKASRSMMQSWGIRRWYSFADTQIKVAGQLSHFITDSKHSLQEITESFGLAADKFRIIYCGVDREIFREVPGSVRPANRILVINSGDTPLKGLKYLLEAIAEIRRTKDIELVIVGEPMKNGYTQGLIESLKLSDCARYTGKIDTDKLVQHYSEATMLVVPSIYEGFGLPAAEAMACGAPVISTTAGALPEVVSDAGILVPPGDTRAIVEAIKTLLDDENRRRQLGALGRERVARLFNWDTAAKETAEVYRDAIEKQAYVKAG
ncbi:MAG: glycosyltransferase family 4 protein [Chloroflexi bacterium]|nr:glycosyltransferase family 4 protein [Chloroflexota bacterium]